MCDFKAASLEAFEKIDELLSSGLADDSAYSRTDVLGWNARFLPELFVTDDFAALRFTTGGKTYYNAPLVADKGAFQKAVEALEKDGVDTFICASDWQVEILNGMDYRTESDRNMWEYLYLPLDLAELKGKKYHAKRNFINSFPKNYVYREYVDDDCGALSELLNKWNNDHLEKSELMHPDASWTFVGEKALQGEYNLEKETILLALSHRKEWKLFADVLELNGVIVGFAAGELMANGVGVIYFQKAEVELKGAYPVLDNCFVRAHFGSARLINKQEDMGIEGLRTAKLNYHPIKMAERYTAYKVGKGE